MGACIPMADINNWSKHKTKFSHISNWNTHRTQSSHISNCNTHMSKCSHDQIGTLTQPSVLTNKHKPQFSHTSNWNTHTTQCSHKHTQSSVLTYQTVTFTWPSILTNQLLETPSFHLLKPSCRIKSSQDYVPCFCTLFTSNKDNY